MVFLIKIFKNINFNLFNNKLIILKYNEFFDFVKILDLVDFSIF